MILIRNPDSPAEIPPGGGPIRCVARPDQLICWRGVEPSHAEVMAATGVKGVRIILPMRELVAVNMDVIEQADRLDWLFEPEHRGADPPALQDIVESWLRAHPRLQRLALPAFSLIWYF
jgi:hypothetical protein